MNRIFPTLAAVALCLGLNACRRDAPPLEVTAFSEETGRLQESDPPPLLGFANAPSSSYQAAARRSPFAPPNSSGGQPTAALAVGAAAPNHQRPRQPLESFPLSDLVWVGALSRGGERRALVRDGDGKVHQVHVGDYLGSHHGRIQRIADASIELVEVVADGGGGWVRRQRTLAATPLEATP